MANKKDKRFKALKVFTISVFLFVFLIVAAWQTGLQILKNKGITFAGKHFRFPAELLIEDLAFKQPGIDFSAKSVLVNWSWTALIKGNFDGDFIKINGLKYKQTALPETKTDTTTTGSFSLPFLNYRLVAITNAEITIQSNNDSAILFLPDLVAYGLKTGRNVAVDSIINNGSVLHLAHSSETEMQSGETNFDPAIIPDLQVMKIAFNDCGFLVRIDSSTQKIDDFDLLLTGEKAGNISGLNLEKIGFTYQDSINVLASIDTVLINNSSNAIITNLNFFFPGLKLHIPELKINSFLSPQIAVNFRESEIQNGFMKMFFPDYALQAEDSETLVFSGNLRLGNSAFHISEFDGKLGAKTTLKGNADFDYSGEHNVFNFNFRQVNTSLAVLASYFGYQLPKNQKNIDISGDLDLEGSSQQFTTAGVLMANGMPFYIDILANYSTPGVNDFDVKLGSEKFELEKVYADSSGFTANHIKISSQIETDTTWHFKKVQLAITGDSVKTNNYFFEKPDISFNYQPLESCIRIATLTDSINIFAKAAGDLFNYKNLVVSGDFAIDLPVYDSITDGFTRILSNFSARYNAGKTAWVSSFDLDSLCFLPDSGAAYVTHADVDFKFDTVSGYEIDAAFGEKSKLLAKAPAGIFEWVKQREKFKSPAPEIQVKCYAEIDSSLVYRFTGIKGYFDLNNFEIKTEDNELKVNVDMPFFSFDNYSAKNFDAKIDINSNLNYADIQLESFINPYAVVEKVAIASKQISVDKTAFNVGFYLPEVDEKIAFKAIFSEFADGFGINFEEVYNLTLGKMYWKSEESKGIVFDRNYNLSNSSVVLSTAAQRIAFEYNNETATVKIDSLGLTQLSALFMPGTNFEGVLNAAYEYNTNSGDMAWNGTIPGFTFDSIFSGTLVSRGHYNEKSLKAFVDIQEFNGEIKLDISGAESNYLFNLDIKNFDLAYLNSFPGVAEVLQFEGILNSKVLGSYDGEFLSSGYVAFENNKFSAEDYGLTFGIDRDTIWLKNSQVDFHSLAISDFKNNELTIDGKVDFSTNPAFDINLRSRNFVFFDQSNQKQLIYGNVSLATDLLISGTLAKPAITGWLKTLPGGFLHYTYESTVKLDDREKVVTFTDFTNPESEKPKTKPKTAGVKTDWNVDVDFGRTEIYVLIDETVQDNAKLTAAGKLQLRSGAGSVPLIFGSVSSADGSVYYDAPMVSDVNLKIDNAAVTWKGDWANPVLSFRGSEAFRISAAEVPGSGGSKTDKIGATVLATVNDCTPDNFVLNFDVISTNATLANYLNRFTTESRQSLAINLLLFGSLETMGSMTGSSGVMSSVVSKLNEISRKNIKKADLSFYADTQTADDKAKQETLQKVGYSFSEGFFNEKVKLTVGGNIDFSDDEDHGKKFNPLGTVQLDYVLKENPEINLFAARKDIYKGVFDGQVQESGAGISFRKRFRNLFRFSKKKNTYEK